MNENQKKVLIATAIGLVIWSGYRLYIKRPIPPMRPIKSADTSGSGSSNFTGYSDMTGKAAYSQDTAKLQGEFAKSKIAKINKMLDKNLGTLTTSQINSLREERRELGLMINKQPQGSSASATIGWRTTVKPVK